MVKKTKIKYLGRGGFRLSDGWKLGDSKNGISVNWQLSSLSIRTVSLIFCESFLTISKQFGALNFRS